MNTPELEQSLDASARLSVPTDDDICDIMLMMDICLQFGGSEAIITALSDEFPVIGRHRELFVLCLFSLYFVVGLASCSQVC